MQTVPGANIEGDVIVQCKASFEVGLCNGSFGFLNDTAEVIVIKKIDAGANGNIALILSCSLVSGDARQCDDDECDKCDAVCFFHGSYCCPPNEPLQCDRLK